MIALVFILAALIFILGVFFALGKAYWDEEKDREDFRRKYL